MGEKQFQEVKKSGGSTEATTFGDNHKQAFEKEGREVIPQKDETVEDIKKRVGEDKNIEQTRYVRDSEVAWFNDDWLYDLIHPFIHRANKDAGWKYNWDYSESFQFTKYNPGGFYGWHADGQSCHFGRYKRYIPGISPMTKDGRPPRGYTSNPNMVNKVRKLSLTLNLNKPGALIVFPSYVYHQVTPVTRGTRYSLVLWSLGEPFK